LSVAAVLAATPWPRAVAAPAITWQPVGRIDDQRIVECSGIAASRRYPGIFWVHNDSGHPAVLFAVKDTGEVIAEVPVEGAANIDWEDIAADAAGHLYLADTGNNFGMFPVRSVYQLTEPDPYASPVQPARVVRRYKYTFPAERFDAEGLYVCGDHVYVVSKPRGRRAAIYRLDPVADDRYQPVEVTSLAFGWATAADLSPDGKRLAVCTETSVRLFSVDDQGVPLDGPEPVLIRYPASGTEACCFDGADLVLTSEKGTIYRITATHLAEGTRFTRPIKSPRPRQP
jgi:hypothetical protein